VFGSSRPALGAKSGFVLVRPPGKGHRGDWQWWVAAVLVLVSVMAIFVGLQLLVG